MTFERTLINVYIYICLTQPIFYYFRMKEYALNHAKDPQHDLGHIRFRPTALRLLGAPRGGPQALRRPRPGFGGHLGPGWGEVEWRCSAICIHVYICTY